MNLSSFSNKIKFIFTESANLISAIRLLTHTIVQYNCLKMDNYNSHIASKILNLNLKNTQNSLKLRNQDIAILYETYLDKVYDYPFTIHKESTILDLGSHVGISATFLNTKYQPSKMICVEPDYDNYCLLEHNLPSSKIYNCAISNKVGKAYLNNKTKSVNYHIAKTGIEIKTITIDLIIKENNLEVIDLLKIDIEGFKYHLFTDFEY